MNILLTILLLIILLFYYFYELYVFKEERLEIYTNKLENFKITHISDFHNNKYLNINRLKKEIDLFNPNIIVLTGDLINRNTRDFSNVEKLLMSISEYKVYFVEGNHERDNRNKEELYHLFKKYNIIDLSCKEMIINENIKIYGNRFGTSYDYNGILNNDMYNILLSHDPKDYLTNLKSFDLVLSGHTHGGQVRIPYFGQILGHGPSFFPKYSKGKYIFKNTILYINSGIGQHKNIRINDRISYSNIEIKKRLK